MESSRKNMSSEVSPSRWEAARIFFRVEKGEKVSELLDLKRKVLSPVDESLLRELVYGCTRQKRLLDHHLKGICTTPFAKLPQEVKVALRLGLYQMLFLTRVPVHAAVNESVNLIKQSPEEKASGFVNAVLRVAESKKAEFTLEGENELDTLALKHSHPTWIVKRWAEFLEPPLLEEVLKADNLPHPVYFHTKPGSLQSVQEDLTKENVRLADVGWPPRALRLAGHEGGLFSGESFGKGDWIVQDWVPQAMLEMLPLKGGERVWDVCAAPGGKTVALAWAVGEKGQVLATDASSERRKRLSENIQRTQLKNVMVFEEAVEKLQPSQKFDMIWVDAPCSGTGVLSRRADLRWNLTAADIRTSTEQQKALLAMAERHLYPKGYLVYSTCSLEKEENADVVLDFLNQNSQYHVLQMSAPADRPEIVRGTVGLTFWPLAGHDGGFLAVLQKQ